MARPHPQLRTELSRRPEAMQKKRRTGSASTIRPIEDEIAHLPGLDLNGLRARWQSIFGRPAPARLTRHLLFAVIAIVSRPIACDARNVSKVGRSPAGACSRHHSRVPGTDLSR